MKSKPSRKPATAHSRRAPLGLLADNVARFMAYAYWRGRCDQRGMPEGAEKEAVIKTVGDLEWPQWVCAAKTLLSANDALCRPADSEAGAQKGQSK